GILTVILALLGSANEQPANLGKPSKPHPFLAEGKSGMVVGLTGPRAVHAGLGVLKQGGSAADAAMATAITQVVEVAGSYISLAGILSMTYFDAATGSVQYLNACYNIPKAEDDPLSIPKLDPFALKGKPSGRTALVPGFLAGVEAAHQRFGKLAFGKLFESAIALADQGFPINYELAGFIERRTDV